MDGGDVDHTWRQIRILRGWQSANYVELVIITIIPNSAPFERGGGLPLTGVILPNVQVGQANK